MIVVEEEEDEEAVFIRGVNTNEDSPNAQHAPHRSVQDTGAMSGLGDQLRRLTKSVLLYARFTAFVN